MELPQWIKDHIALYRSDPDKALYWDASLGGGSGMLKTLLLTTKGRKSGKPLSLPLIFDAVGDDFVVIASKGGAPEHPHWYQNLVANSDAEIQVGRAHYRVRARAAQGQERAALWARLAKLYPPYDAYQERAGACEIPVVVLAPARASERGS
jgi:deazaflavin-dependent oxidoreductase (nitroreductase family)